MIGWWLFRVEFWCALPNYAGYHQSWFHLAHFALSEISGDSEIRPTIWFLRSRIQIVTFHQNIVTTLLPKVNLNDTNFLFCLFVLRLINIWKLDEIFNKNDKWRFYGEWSGKKRHASDASSYRNWSSILIVLCKNYPSFEKQAYFMFWRS